MVRYEDQSQDLWLRSPSNQAVRYRLQHVVALESWCRDSQTGCSSAAACHLPPASWQTSEICFSTQHFDHPLFSLISPSLFFSPQDLSHTKADPTPSVGNGIFNLLLPSSFTTTRMDFSQYPSSKALEALGAKTAALCKSLNPLYARGVLTRPEPFRVILIGDQSHVKSDVLESILGVSWARPPDQDPFAIIELIIESSDISSSGFELESTTEEDSSSSAGQPSLEPPQHIRRMKARSATLHDMAFVDIPGFCQSGNRDQTGEDCPHIGTLAESYLNNPASIILVVLSSPDDVTTSKAMHVAKKYDPTGRRTWGVVNCPSEITEDVEEGFSLFTPDNAVFKLCKNWVALFLFYTNDREFESSAQYSIEEEFYEVMVPEGILSNSRGISVLRKLLSTHSFVPIRERLPLLISEVRQNIKDQNLRLFRLGKERSSVEEMRAYLLKIADQFRTLSTAAIRGDYGHEFFQTYLSKAGDSSKEVGRVRKLRIVLKDLNDVFDFILSTRGAQRRLSSASQNPEEDESQLPENLRHAVSIHPTQVSSEVDMIEFAREVAERRRKCQTPGHVLAVELFREQASRWEDIATTHLQTVHHISRSFALDLLSHLVGPRSLTYTRISAHFLTPFFEKKWTELSEKLAELLHHYREGIIQPLEIEAPEDDHRAAKRQKLSGGLACVKGGPSRAPEQTKAEQAAEHIIDGMMSYYNVSCLWNNQVLLFIFTA